MSEMLNQTTAPSVNGTNHEQEAGETPRATNRLNLATLASQLEEVRRDLVAARLKAPQGVRTRPSSRLGWPSRRAA